MNLIERLRRERQAVTKEFELAQQKRENRERQQKQEEEGEKKKKQRERVLTEAHVKKITPRLKVLRDYVTREKAYPPNKLGEDIASRVVESPKITLEDIKRKVSPWEPTDVPSGSTIRRKKITLSWKARATEYLYDSEDGEWVSDGHKEGIETRGIEIEVGPKGVTDLNPHPKQKRFWKRDAFGGRAMIPEDFTEDELDDVLPGMLFNAERLKFDVEKRFDKDGNLTQRKIFANFSVNF